eukprot:3400247-Pleurochrysis_carterae.AAC.1
MSRRSGVHMRHVLASRSLAHAGGRLQLGAALNRLLAPKGLGTQFVGGQPVTGGRCAWGCCGNH